MAKSSYQEGIIKRYYENRDTIALQNLGEIASDLFLCEDPKKKAKLWERAGKALNNTDASAQEKTRIDQILGGRDVAGLCRLVNELASPDRAGSKPGKENRADPPKTSAPPPPGTPPPLRSSTGTAGSTPQEVDASDPLVLKKAMKAFRKRLKLTRLDEESKLGVGPFSGGKASGIVAITPPVSFPTEVWEKLAELGRLKKSGRGFYELADG